MKLQISPTHKKALSDINRNLMELGCQEANFTKVELLFYEALDTARQYGTDPDANELLQRLSQVRAQSYPLTSNLYQKKLHRERSIRQFIRQFRGAIAGKASAVA
jgi:diketogulonate reductase-like aldo/keto reductase